ncbi:MULTISPECIES: TetR/AcrR family transcriptional regulator C-terminal domain-containing protein [unclassified Pseudomonas]|uniref:TetR/AcrR family transcriptional regulator C-terminal domain-containing protein n=1 Tax=unclassified Pseudomonas TaxID=196821 RepID=UPI0015A25299|nr:MULTISPECIES: TetR/AcrR family transcriptional regulator C-terminal domain-containing protein [unclassified Pseudomonas]MDQ0670837.1 TetR/AcrR family tetracycline transcriptional repressor [Pseudomonas sp. W2I6]NVZ14311.1 TetR/AcrR family transcriptional regulator C-terminal domain-containing protein [Pseudomonas sp. IPO3775]NWA78571.1 TetR/AcrR family transcriptional regulator C-terminal domain-containing protein [Pseudomonas sp. C8002]
MTSKTANPRGRRKKSAGEDSKNLLTAQIITAAALELIDQEGLEKFSLRTLASALGVYPTAIYWYVSSRELLLAQVLAKVLEHLAPEPQERWQDYLRAAMVNCHNAVHQHPNIAPLLGAQLVSNTRTDFKLVEGVLAALQQAGFNGPTLASAYNTFIAALTGFTTLEFAPLPENTEAWQNQVQQSLQQVDPQQHPTLAQNMDQLSNRSFSLRWQNGVQAALDDSFAFYVETIICGLETLASRR